MSDEESLVYINSLNSNVNQYPLSNLDKGYDDIFTKIFFYTIIEN
ncbi:hypothetical protein THALO_30183 [Tenacibaculum halocynthiae]